MRIVACMLAVLEVLASALYLMPVAVVVAVCWSRERAPAELAIYIPSELPSISWRFCCWRACAAWDGVIVISRLAWAAAGGGLGLWRRRQARVKAAALAGPVVLVMAVAGLLALVISAWLSRRYALWDRQWHIPLVTSLRGQSLPFWNVSEPGAPLHYHVSGDVLAATLQALSGARLHASSALSLAHDLLFALVGVAVSALLVRPGRAFGWSAFAAVAPLGVLLAGPPSTTVGLTGFSYFNYYQMSYRPHVALAGLLIVGIVAAVRSCSTAGAGGAAVDRIRAAVAGAAGDYRRAVRRHRRSGDRPRGRHAAAGARRTALVADHRGLPPGRRACCHLDPPFDAAGRARARRARGRAARR